MSLTDDQPTAGTPRIAIVAPRNMRFSPENATSIDLYIHEIARTSRHRHGITVFAERMPRPFDDVDARFWDKQDGPREWLRLVADTEPDLVVVHQHQPTAVMFAQKLGKGVRGPGGRARVALVRHNFVKPPGNRLSAWRKRRQFACLDALAFVSGCCRDAFGAQWGGCAGLPPLFVTPNGIDTAAWAPVEKALQIAFVGRLTPEKGVLEAAEAVARTLPRHPGWRAVFVLDAGGAPSGYREAVEARLAAAGDRVRVRFNLPHDEVRRIVAESAIALAPTQNAEPFGRVAVEALASGAALIASRAGGFVEICGEAAILLDTPSAPNLATAIDALIDDDTLRTRLAAMGPERIAGRYDIASAAAAFDEMADALLPPRPADANGRPMAARSIVGAS